MKEKKSIIIDPGEIHFDFIRSSGPGGQNVNKVSTAAQLRFNLLESESIDERLKARLIQKLKGKLNSKGEIIITARRFRTQEKNKIDAIKRLTKLLEKASEVKAQRIPTKRTKSSKEKRLKTKKQRSEIKKSRSSKIKPDNF